MVRKEGLEEVSVHNKGSRPKLTPTETITLRIPTPVMDVIRRRAAYSNMTPTIWLYERVIRNEVVRQHGKLESRKISNEVKMERGEDDGKSN